MLQLHKYSVKCPEKNTNSNNKQKQINKQENRKTELQNITITATGNTNLQSQASYSLQHILHRRYYLAIPQMTSIRKDYNPCLLGSYLILTLQLTQSNLRVEVNHAARTHSLNCPSMNSNADENIMKMMMTMTI